MKTSAKIISISVCCLALAFPQLARAIPNFYSAKWADFSEVDNSEIGTRTPLILIHGIQSDASIWNSFLNYYNSTPALKDNFKPYVFQYYTANYLMTASDPTTIQGLGQSLGNYLQQWYSAPTRSPVFGFNGRPVVILAHSMGGLVARSMMANYHFTDGATGRDKVSLLITLATPHHGSPAANEFYTLPSAVKWVGSAFYDLNSGIAYDLSWDCYNGLGYFGYCGQGIASSPDYPKIIAYGGKGSSVAAVGNIYKVPFAQILIAGYDNDGVVPLESALFNGSSVRTRQVNGSCDHSEIYSGSKTVGGGTAIFDSISADLQTAIPVTPLPPVIFDVSPPALTGLPLPQTQLIQIIGSGFKNTSTLTFNDGVNPPYTGRVPTFVSGSELDYNIAVGPNTATWTVKVVNGAQESNTRTFTVVATPPPATGSLTVSLQPSEAVTAGAQWQVDSGAWHNSGDVVTSLTPGSHTVACKAVTGYTTPASKSVSIVGGAVTSDTETYTISTLSTYTLTLNNNGSPQGYITPQPFGSNGNNYNSGAVVQLTATANYGYHFVSWSGDVSGTANPTSIVMNGNKSVTASFASGDPNLGTLIVTIQPPEAAAAGVKWGWNENDYRDSGSSVLTFPGSYLLVIHLTNGWWGSGYYPVTVVAGQTTNYNFTLSSTTESTTGSDPSTYYTLAGAVTNSGSADGIGNAARFYRPWSIAVDKAGNAFVADSWNNTIRKVTPSGAVSTVAGLALSAGTNDGISVNARFNQPQGVAVDTNGNLYVGDFYNYTIRKITPDGTVSTLAGLAGSTGSADGTGSVARFNQPAGVAVDNNGNVYVADFHNHTIRKITPAGAVSTLAGLAGSHGGADGIGSTARFFYPSGVAVDNAGNVYVAEEYNHTIRTISPGGSVTTLAGFPQSGGAADGTGSAARFSYPEGVAVDTLGNVYVADNGNNTIRKVTPAGVVTTLAGLSGNAGSADGTGSTVRFNSPTGIAVDSAGVLLVADASNYTIRTTRPPLPKLTLNLLADQAVFSWPTSSIGFIIESSTSLTVTNWATVFPLPTTVGAENRVTNAISGGARFYRLKR